MKLETRGHLTMLWLGRAAVLFLALATPAEAFEAKFLMASTVDLANPHDVKLSIDDRWLFVSDVDNGWVAILDAKSLSLVGQYGADHWNSTHDLDIGEDGRLYVADNNNHRVGVYELTGTKAEFVGELSERIRKPEGVLAGPGGRTYVTGAGSDNPVVYVNGKDHAGNGRLFSPARHRVHAKW